MASPLMMRRDHGEELEEQYHTGGMRPHLNKEDPGSLLATLKWLLIEKHGLSELEPEIKAFSRKVNQAWQARER